VIDWLTLRIFGTDLRIDAGQVLSIDADGLIEWRSLKRLSVEGSHSSTVQVRTMPHDLSVEISGNPAKWFQGHNVFGSDDIAHLAREFARSVLARAGYSIKAEAQDMIDRGIIVLTRVDVTESWDFGSRLRALSAVQALSELSAFKHRGRGSMTDEGTVYWRKHSRRIASKAYAKGLELTKHKLPDELAQRDRIFAAADGLVRFEFTLRSMWLKDRGLDVLQNWGTKGVTPATLHTELMAGLNISDARMRETLLADLPPRLQAIYQAWADGHDVRAMFKSRATFYRYRAELLKLGVDLAIKQPREESNVVPLRVVLTGKPFSVPDWARGTSAYFEARQAA
jgi:II/X family phage/plasmid replication protein